ncbi:MAG: hypothetical protein Q7S08_01855 [bacterium]|nr:hypothetical protein [bacterium]
MAIFTINFSGIQCIRVETLARSYSGPLTAGGFMKSKYMKAEKALSIKPVVDSDFRLRGLDVRPIYFRSLATPKPRSQKKARGRGR